MPITPDQAGFNRDLSQEERDEIDRVCVKIDEKLKKAFSDNPKAIGIYVECDLSYLIEGKVKAIYEGKGWNVSSDNSPREGYFLVFTPKRLGTCLH